MPNSTFSQMQHTSSSLGLICLTATITCPSNEERTSFSKSFNYLFLQIGNITSGSNTQTSQLLQWNAYFVHCLDPDMATGTTNPLPIVPHVHCTRSWQLNNRTIWAFTRCKLSNILSYPTKKAFLKDIYNITNRQCMKMEIWTYIRQIKLRAALRGLLHP